MEKVIDRKEYRRNNETNNKIDEEQIGVLQKRIRIFLHQSLLASLTFLVVSFLRFYNCQDILDKIDVAINNEVSILSLKKSGQIIYDKCIEYYGLLNNYIDNILQNKLNFAENNYNIYSGVLESGDGKIESLTYITAESNSSPINILKDTEDKQGEIQNDTTSKENESLVNFETAVEGINQMSEDAKYINKNYKLIVPVIGTITSEFGVRNSNNPIVSAYHSGLDIAANTGTQILSAIDGEVLEASTDTYYGKYLKIKKDDIVIIYAHCSKLLVKTGEKVKKGELIAYVGNTGNSTGPHLHFEVKYKDRLVNPLDILEI